jgi:orotidine-5'-phosphate decarboxylase
MGNIIRLDRSVIPACDFDLKTFRQVLQATGDLDKVGGYKIGPALTGRPGYDKVVEIAKEHTDKPLIFDPQKWATDIPDTAMKLMEPVKQSGIDTIILFPQSGPITQHKWIKAAQELELGVIVGGEMTHPRYLGNDLGNPKGEDYDKIFHELGIGGKLQGYIRESAPDDIYELAARMGVTNFVVPGNKPDRIEHYRKLIEDIVGEGNASFFAPGFVAQGGNLNEGAKAAGESFHGIVGRGIYKAENMRAAALELTQKL